MLVERIGLPELTSLSQKHECTHLQASTRPHQAVQRKSIPELINRKEIEETASKLHTPTKISSSSHLEQKPKLAMKKNSSKMFRVAWRQCNTRDTVEDHHGQAQRKVHLGTKISIIKILSRRIVSEIKLKRTDTTLDLSQKAKRAKEKKKKSSKELAAKRRICRFWRWSVRGCEHPVTANYSGVWWSHPNSHPNF